MKIVVVGGTGTIGAAVAAALQERHDVVTVGNSSGDLQVDITSRGSIEQLFGRIGSFDALVSAAGSAAFKPLDQLSDEDFTVSVRDKLMGQINLVRFGLSHVADGGSFTLTSGILSREPVPGTSAIAMVNGALESFARAAALEMPRGVRINVVSPPWISETLTAMGRDPAGGIPAARAALAYVDSVDGARQGEVLDAREFV